jgi:hypothetical protein
MDGITPEIPAPGKTLNYKDGTFLLTLYNPIGSFNPFEVRYPVFPSQISKVIIAALYTQTDKIKVYHIAGTEKKGITKAEIIINYFVNDDVIIKKLIPNFKEIIKRIPITPVKNREMDDSNSKLVAGAEYNKDDNYPNFMEKLKAVYNRCTLKKGGDRSKKH